MSKPAVSIIIPSWTGEVNHVMESIEQQTFHDYEIIIVKGVSPAARARNLGIQKARGDILLFIDDDASFGHEHIFCSMMHLLEENEQVAIVGISQQVSTEITRFQREVASQVPRYSYPVVSENTISNPPLHSFGFTAVTTLCCAVRRSVFKEVGGFNEALISGEDTDFFYRVHRQGYNLVVAANCWVYHDPPANLKTLLRKSFWYGIGHALEARISPERGMDILPLNRWYGQLGLLVALIAFPFAFFVHYYFTPIRQLIFGFRPLKTLSTYACLCGYIYGWYHSKFRSIADSYEIQRNSLEKVVENVL